MKEELWKGLRNELQEIGGKQHMDHPPYKPKMVEEEFQIEQLLDMGFSEFKATMLEYKKRLDMGLLHSKAEIAKLEGYIQILKRKIVELENEKAQVREIVKEKK